MSAPVKSRELVPVTRLVIGKPDELRNVIETARRSGRLVRANNLRAVDMHHAAMDLTILEAALVPDARPRWLVRLRRRVLETVWPSHEGTAARVVRAVLYVLGAGVSAAVGYAVYEMVRFVIRAVELTHRFWPALLILALVGAAAGGKHVAKFCHACGRAIH